MRCVDPPVLMCLEQEFVDENGTVVSGNYVLVDVIMSFSITAISVDVIFYRQN